MNQHGYYEPGRIFTAGDHPPEPGPKCPCCRLWHLTPDAEIDPMRKAGDPIIALQTGGEGRIIGYWSPEPHPKLVKFHQNNQQATLF